MSKGAVSLFFKWSDLGSNVHVTDAEVDDAYNVCNQIKLAFNTKAASISLTMLHQKYPTVFPKS